MTFRWKNPANTSGGNLKAFVCCALALLGGGCTSGGSQTVPDAAVAPCTSTVMTPGLHPAELGLRDALAESDRRLCEAARGPQREVQLVLSFSRLLRPDEVEAVVRRHGLRVTMLEVKRGSGRAQLPVEDGALAPVLTADRGRFDRWLAEETAFVAQLRERREEGEQAARNAAEIARLEGVLARARETGPVYSAVAVTTATTTLAALRLDSEIRYVVAADMMDYAKGIDPESGEWR